MRVAMVYELFWPSPGGIESWIANISRILARRGHKVTIITGSVKGDIQPLNNVEIRQLDFLGLMRRTHVPGTTQLTRQLLWTLALSKYLKNHSDEFAIIHAHVQASFLGCLLAKGKNKLIYHWHGTYHEWNYRMYPFPLALFYDVADHVIAHLPYDACITADKYTRELAIEHIGANSSRIIPVLNGVDTVLFKPTRVTPSEVGWPGGGPFIIAARRLVPKNGLQFLIPAVQQLIGVLPETKLMIYGAGPLEPFLKKMVSKLGLSNSVFFKGHVRHSDLPRLYNAADVVAVPSLIEATSLGCLEAMACAKPLLTCPVGGIPEILVPGCAVSVKPGSPQEILAGLKHLLCELSDKDRAEMGKTARQHVEKNFTWENTADNVIGIYEALLSK